MFIVPLPEGDTGACSNMSAQALRLNSCISSTKGLVIFIILLNTYEEGSEQQGITDTVWGSSFGLFLQRKIHNEH